VAKSGNAVLQSCYALCSQLQEFFSLCLKRSVDVDLCSLSAICPAVVDTFDLVVNGV